MQYNHSLFSLINKIGTFMYNKYNITTPEKLKDLINKASQFEDCPEFIKGLWDVLNGKTMDEVRACYENKYRKLMQPWTKQYQDRITANFEKMIDDGRNLEKVIDSYYENKSPELKETIMKGIEKFFHNPDAYRYYGKYLFNEVYSNPDILDLRPLPDKETYDDMLRDTWEKAKKIRELNDEAVEIFLNLVHYANVLLKYNYANTFYRACAGARLTNNGILLEEVK